MFFQTPALDLKLFLLINQQWRCGLFDFIMPIISEPLALLFIIVPGLAYALFKGGKRQLAFFAVLIVGMAISDFTGNFIKDSVGRVRPLNAIAETYLQEDGEWTQRPADYVQTKEKGTSFTSNHSSNTMCLAVLAMLIWPALKRWPLLLPLLVGYSRIYLGKHYPTDVLGGWLYGAVVALAVWTIWEYAVRPRLPEKSSLRR
ncbi:phosphatase PAP2 family protein [Pseudodesulfovibrio sp. zrk46]|uniref:phosphatase PAP2 family protein n=1 Tax=Pseudodesulfovibrio sp. zrk46 TaxID=2725288 RepID=UPI0014492136|nr:phosphatase PAP2 family protein [Pseudodesulfovibrio sp. zrk46]QJB54908.1 phosphatase PAP2 family protein [Pseudodesulfovibrio sp. zrk46]